MAKDKAAKSESGADDNSSESQAGRVIEPNGQDLSLLNVGNPHHSAAILSGKADASGASMSPEQINHVTTDLHAAMNRKTLGFDSPDKDRLVDLLEVCNKADRKAIEETYERLNPGRSLREDLKVKFGKDKPEFVQIEALLNRNDRSDECGQIRIALAKLKQAVQWQADTTKWHDLVKSSPAGSFLTEPLDGAMHLMHQKDIHDQRQAETELFKILSVLSAKQIENLKQTYKTNYNGANLESDLTKGTLSNEMRSALPIALKGIDKRNVNDSVRLAELAAASQRVDMFADVLQGSSTKVRELFKKSPVAGDIDKLFSGEDLAVAKDIVDKGEIDLARRLAADTRIYHVNKDDITNAVSSVSEESRQRYINGQEIAQHKSAPNDADSRHALKFYQDIHELLNKAGSHQEALKWEAMLMNQEVHQAIGQVFKDNAANFWEESWKHNTEKASEKIIGLADFNPQERADYKNNTNGFKNNVDSLVDKNLENGLEKDLAHRVLANLSHDKQPLGAIEKVMLAQLSDTSPHQMMQYIDSAFASDKSLLARVHSAHPTPEDAALKRYIGDALNQAVDKAGLGQRTAGKENYIPSKYPEMAKSLFETGHIPLELKRQLYPDRQLELADFLGASASEKKQLLNVNPDASTRDFQIKVMGGNAQAELVRNVLTQGKIGNEDKLRSFVLAEHIAPVQARNALLEMPLEERQAVARQYFDKYHQLLSSDLIEKAKRGPNHDIAAQEVRDFKDILSPCETSLRQKYFDSISESHQGPLDRAMSGFWDSSKLGSEEGERKLAKFLADNADQIDRLDPERQKQLNNALATLRQAQINYITSKGALSEGLVDATIGVAAVAGACFSGGASVELLSILGPAGAVYRIGAMKALEGSDFKGKPQDLLEHGFKGGFAVIGGLIGPEALGLKGVIKVSDAAANFASRSAFNTIASQDGKLLFKSDAVQIIRSGLKDITRQDAVIGYDATKNKLRELASRAVTDQANHYHVEKIAKVLASELKVQSTREVRDKIILASENLAKSAITISSANASAEVASTAIGLSDPNTLGSRLGLATASGLAGAMPAHFLGSAAGSFLRKGAGMIGEWRGISLDKFAIRDGVNWFPEAGGLKIQRNVHGITTITDPASGRQIVAKDKGTWSERTADGGKSYYSPDPPGTNPVKFQGTRTFFANAADELKQAPKESAAQYGDLVQEINGAKVYQDKAGNRTMVRDNGNIVVKGADGKAVEINPKLKAAPENEERHLYTFENGATVVDRNGVVEHHDPDTGNATTFRKDGTSTITSSEGKVLKEFTPYGELVNTYEGTKVYCDPSGNQTVVHAGGDGIVLHADGRVTDFHANGEMWTQNPITTAVEYKKGISDSPAPLDEIKQGKILHTSEDDVQTIGLEDGSVALRDLKSHKTLILRKTGEVDIRDDATGVEKQAGKEGSVGEPQIINPRRPPNHVAGQDQNRLEPTKTASNKEQADAGKEVPKDLPPQFGKTTPPSTPVGTSRLQNVEDKIARSFKSDVTLFDNANPGLRSPLSSAVSDSTRRQIKMERAEQGKSISEHDEKIVSIERKGDKQEITLEDTGRHKIKRIVHDLKNPDKPVELETREGYRYTVPADSLPRVRVKQVINDAEKKLKDAAAGANIELPKPGGE